MRLNPEAANDEAEVLDQRHERRNADVHEARESDVRIRQRVVDRRRDDGADLGRGAARHFLRNEYVGHQRAVRPVLFGRADGDDDGVMRLEERFDFGVSSSLRGTRSLAS